MRHGQPVRKDRWSGPEEKTPAVLSMRHVLKRQTFSLQSHTQRDLLTGHHTRSTSENGGALLAILPDGSLSNGPQSPRA